MDPAIRQHVKNFIKVVVVLVIVMGVLVGSRHLMSVKFYEYRYPDIDRDGIANYMDMDVDGDGIDNHEDDDANGNGLSNLHDILEAADELAKGGYSFLPFGGWKKEITHKLLYFENVDAVLIPHEKAGIYLGLKPDGPPDTITTTRDLYNFIQENGSFYTIRTRYDLPTPGDIAFFGPDFCALVVKVDENDYTVQMLVCEAGLGMCVATMERIQHNGHTLTEYGTLTPQ